MYSIRRLLDFSSNRGKIGILSRALSLDDIEDIRHHFSDMELEKFVHDTIFMTYSSPIYFQAMSIKEKNSSNLH